jgi:hypothetical protein
MLALLCRMVQQSYASGHIMLAVCRCCADELLLALLAPALPASYAAGRVVLSTSIRQITDPRLTDYDLLLSNLSALKAGKSADVSVHCCFCAA